MICRHIGTSNVSDSNRFFRKLWTELDLVRKNAWNYAPFTIGHEKTVHIGQNNFGVFKYDYKTKGTINNLYFEGSPESEAIVNSIVTKTLREYVDISKRRVGFVVSNDNAMKLAACSLSGIKVFQNKNDSIISFEIDSYGNLDLKHHSIQKAYQILHVILAFTNISFANSDVIIDMEEPETDDNIDWDKSYTYDWIDSDELPCDKYGDIILPKECIKLMSQIALEDCPCKSIQLIINSGQLIYYGNQMYLEIFNTGEKNQTGYVDIFNAVLISALEPLSNIGAGKCTRCEKCGNDVYSVARKLKEFLTKYFPTHIVKDICGRVYGNRSKFLHEGYAMTSERYIGTSFPQINPHTGNSMLVGSTYAEYSLREYVTFAFRQCVRDYFADSICSS